MEDVPVRVLIQVRDGNNPNIVWEGSMPMSELGEDEDGVNTWDVDNEAVSKVLHAAALTWDLGKGLRSDHGSED